MTDIADDPRHPCNSVTIPRAQHEALMAAAKAIENMSGYDHLADAWPLVRATIGALRVAGIVMDRPND